MNIYFNHFIKKVDLFKFSIRHEQNGIIDVVVATEDRLLNERKDNITENVWLIYSELRITVVVYWSSNSIDAIKCCKTSERKNIETKATTEQIYAYSRNSHNSLLTYI